MVELHCFSLLVFIQADELFIVWWSIIILTYFIPLNILIGVGPTIYDHVALIFMEGSIIWMAWVHNLPTLKWTFPNRVKPFEFYAPIELGEQSSCKNKSLANCCCLILQESQIALHLWEWRNRPVTSTHVQLSRFFATAVNLNCGINHESEKEVQRTADPKREAH